VIVFVGVAYAVIGVGSAALDDAVWAGGWRPWRVAAWAASLAVAATHIGYEHYRMGAAPGQTAPRAAGAVALGAFGIALGANVHWLRSHTPGQPAPLLALPLFPLITAIPAFLGAFAVATVLTRLSRRRRVA
jgi:hypothetical protein